MRQQHEPRGSNADPAPNRSSDPVLLRDLLGRTLRSLLAQERREDEPTGDLRLALRDICDRARNDGLRAEQLLLALKDAWRELPERRGLPRFDADAAFARVVTACINEYYHSPRLGHFGEARAMHSEARGLGESQNAEI